MLLYFSDDRQNNKYWLLYDDVNEHFHALTDVRQFLHCNFNKFTPMYPRLSMP